MALIIPDSIFAPLTGGTTRGYIAYAPGKDMDAAFDTAARSAQGLDPSNPGAWLDYVSAADATAVVESPVSFDRALAMANAQLSSEVGEPGCYAVPVTAPSAHTRAKVRFVAELLDPLLPEAPASLLPGDSKTQEAYDALLELAKKETAWPGEGYQDVRIDLAGVRRRFKPSFTMRKGPSAYSYAIVDGDRIVARDFPTASNAKATAMAMTRALTDLSQPNFDVVKISMRAEGPYSSVRRDLVMQKARVVVLTEIEKPLAKGGPKTAGWLIYGHA